MGQKGQVFTVPMIQIPPDILDKALAVVIDHQRSMLAVWKGRGRIDVYDVAGTWHETSHPYPREEEGLWSRDDIRGLMVAALTCADPPRVRAAADRPMLLVDVDELGRSSLVRATAAGYAMWQGGESLTVYAIDGTALRTVRVPPSDLPTMSQLMLDLLELSRLLGAPTDPGGATEVPASVAAHPAGRARQRMARGL